MKIAIDASRAINEKAGIGRYSRELVKNLIKIDQKNQYLLIFSYFRTSLAKERLIKTFETENTEIKVLKIPGNIKEKIWGWRLPVLNNMVKDCDLFFAPSFFEVNLGLKIPQIVTINDMTTFLFTSHRGKDISYRLNKRTRQACQKAKKIIAISESTKNDLIKILKISPNKIKVIYPGNTTFKKSGNLPPALKSKSYILFVGTIEPRKNLTGLFKAYALLPPAMQAKYPLAIVGAAGWNTGETLKVYNALKLEGKVKFLGFLSDEKLAKIYQEAAVFVYPSLYEGFGFPVLEALSFGVPVVASKISSLPEVAGNAGILIDPLNPKSITKAIQRFLEGKFEQEKAKKLGPLQAKKFTWEKTAKETIKLFNEVVNG